MGKIKEIIMKSGLYSLVAIIIVGFALLAARTHFLEIVEPNRIIFGGSVDGHEYIRAEIIPDKEITYYAPKQLNMVNLRTHVYQPLNKTIEAFQLDAPLTMEDYIGNIDLQREQLAFDLKQKEIQLTKLKMNAELQYDDLEVLRDTVKQKESLYLQGAYSKSALDQLKQQLKALEFQVANTALDIESLEQAVSIFSKNTALSLDELDAKERALATDPLIITDEDGKFFAQDNYFITYMNEEKVIRKGEAVMSYVPNNAVNDIYVRVYSDVPGGFSPGLETEIRLDILRSDRFIDGKVFKVLHFKDYNEIRIHTERDWAPSSLMNIALTGDIVVYHETGYRVDKSAILPVDGFKKGNRAFIYLLEEKKTIFGVEHVVKKCEVSMTQIGSSMVGFTASGDRYLQSVLRSGERVLIVNYPNGELVDGQHVRLSED